MSTILMFSLGLPGYQETQYRIGGVLYPSHFSALALYQDKKPDRVRVLTTKDANQKTRPQLCESACQIGLSLNDEDFIHIPDGRTDEEIQQILDAIIGAIGHRDRVILDITNSFRHLPFIYFSAIGFLTSLKQVNVEVYYAAFEKDQRETPILDLTALVQLNDWYHALRNLQEAGDVHRLAERIDGEARRGRQAARELRRFAKLLKELDESLAAGLPLETGLNAAAAIKRLKEVPTEQLREFLKVGAGALRPLAEDLDAFSIRPEFIRNGFSGDWQVQDSSRGGKFEVGEKTQVELDILELERELRLIDWYLEHGQVDNALRLMREWMVNRVMLAHGEMNWLDLSTRNRWEYVINAACIRARSVSGQDPEISSGSPHLGMLVSLWSALTDARNAVAHAGFRAAQVQGIGRIAKNVLQGIKAHWGDDRFWRIERSVKYGNILLTPLGTSPGLIYTAVLQARPEVLMVLTSERALPCLHQALDAAGRTDLLPSELGGSEPNHVFILNDPHTGYSEIDHIRNDQRWRDVALCCERITCNITGGTTVLQWCVGALADQASRSGIPVKRVAMVDRRSHDEQQREPFVLGEMIALRDQPGAVASRGGQGVG